MRKIVLLSVWVIALATMGIGCSTSCQQTAGGTCNSGCYGECCPGLNMVCRQNTCTKISP